MFRDFSVVFQSLTDANALSGISVAFGEKNKKRHGQIYRGFLDL